jgi:Tol biopolymer transport system component
MKDVTEGPGREPPEQVTRVANGVQLGSLAISPDGTQLLFTVLSGAGTGRHDFFSQMHVIRTDGSGGADILSDGKSLDMMPSFSPGGDEILFSSNRAGKRLNIWRMSAVGQPGITRLTTGDTNDLWPAMDSDPRPRLYYQAMIDTRPDPRIYMTQIGTVFQTDLTTIGGTQPRVSPRNDAVLFAAVNEKTAKRDIYRVGDRGGDPDNLTNSPDVDDCDPNWSRDGSKILFTSDAGQDSEQRNNYDIWMLDLAKAERPRQITTNGSHDDCPVFDVSGNAVYFRSNRGGQWQIWRVGVR